MARAPKNVPPVEGEAEEAGTVVKVVLEGIGLLRDTGKTQFDPIRKADVPVMKSIRPEIGKPFAFTQEEVDDLMASNPACIRDTQNESVDVPVVGAQPSGAPGDAQAIQATAATGRSALPATESSIGKASDDGEDEEL